MRQFGSKLWSWSKNTISLIGGQYGWWTVIILIIDGQLTIKRNEKYQNPIENYEINSLDQRKLDHHFLLKKGMQRKKVLNFDDLFWCCAGLTTFNLILS